MAPGRPKKQDPSELFKVLAVDTRLSMIRILREEGPIGVTEIAGMLGLTPAAVSQHLRLMRHAGLVTRERDGYRVPYSLDEEGLHTCRGVLMDVCTCSCHGHSARGTRDLASLLKRKEALEEELAQICDEIAKLKSARS
jgi:ArsR family transcriptional regulator